MVFPVNVCSEQDKSEMRETQHNQGACSRKEVIRKVREILNEMDGSTGNDMCLCTDPKSPPPGMKVVTTDCLDGKKGLMKLVPAKTGRYIWVPPPVDNRPVLDPSHHCYAPTVAKQTYNCHIGLAPDKPHPQSSAGQPGTGQLGTPGGHKGVVEGVFAVCYIPADSKNVQGIKGGPSPFPVGQGQQHITGHPSPFPAQPGASSPPGPKRDYCEDPTFVAPEPLGHQAWTNEPGGLCRHPEYCKAHCFEHTPERDWVRH